MLRAPRERSTLLLKENTMKNLFSNLLTLSILSASGAAMADGASPHTITGNVGFTSDYVFNGISQNYRTPALQGGFDYAHSSGLYLGTWASNISGNQYTNASMEWDVYGGYNGKVSDDLGYNIGLMQVFYPGGKTSLIGASTKWDTSELLVGATYKGLNVKYTYTLTDWYGISSTGFTPTMLATGATTADRAGNLNSKGSGYLEANYSYEFPDVVTLSGHVGHQKIQNYSLLNYTDYKIGVNKTVAGFNFGLAYTNTNATDNSLYHVITATENKKLGGSIVALSVNRSF